MYYVRIALCFICTSVAWAAENPITSATEKTDLSIHYLAQIFGVIDGVLHGSGSQILGNLSKAFNSILLILLGTAWAYTAFIGILNTASDGQFLGQRGASIWLPLRMVVGMCALVPKATTGYAVIQVLAMYLVIQGVNFANSVHNTLLQYLERGGTIVETSYSAIHENPEQHQALIRIVGRILKAEVRMIFLYKQLVKQKLADDYQGLPNFRYMLRVEQKNPRVSLMRFPCISQKHARNFKDLEGICGEITWENTPLMNASVQLMVTNLLPLAEQVVNGLVPQQEARQEMPGVVMPQSTGNLQPVPDISIRMSKNQSKAKPAEPSRILHPDYNLPRGKLIHATDDFIALAKSEWRYQAIRTASIKQQELKQLQVTMKRGGWLTAGSHYYQLAQYNQKLNAFNQNLNYNTRLNDIRLAISATQEAALKNYCENTRQYEYLQNCLRKVETYVDQEILYANELATIMTKQNGIDLSRENKAALYHENSLLRPLTKNIKLFQEHLDSTLKRQMDPITSLSSMGHALMGSVESVWKELTNTDKAENFWKETFEKNGLDIVKSGFLMPLILIWMTLNFTIGATLSYYIPLIPFLFYFFGSLTWLVQVMEIVFIGAPLACVGLAHPEGQSFSGKAGQAIKLIIHVMLRPVLMVLGLVAGMTLSTIAFALFNYSYLIAIKMIDQLNGELLGIVSHTAMMGIYTTASYAIVSRTFAMINDLPNKGLRSMEGLTEGNNETEPAMQVKSSIDQYSNTASNPILRPQK